MVKTGKLIVAMGLPGSGKSSVFRETAHRLNCKSLHEPEEEYWPDAVHRRAEVGPFTALSWFRSIRVPLLYEAHASRLNGETVFVDSYYDKLFAGWLGKPGMEWLIPKDDPYFEVAEQVAERDYNLLPNADAIVFFRLAKHDWLKLLQNRGRDLDKDSEFLKSYKTQEYFFQTCKEYCEEIGV